MAGGGQTSLKPWYSDWAKRGAIVLTITKMNAVFSLHSRFGPYSPVMATRYFLTDPSLLTLAYLAWTVCWLKRKKLYCEFLLFTNVFLYSRLDQYSWLTSPKSSLQNARDIETAMVTLHVHLQGVIIVVLFLIYGVGSYSLKNTKVSNAIQNQIVVSLLLKMLLTKMKREIFMLHSRIAT